MGLLILNKFGFQPSLSRLFKKRKKNLIIANDGS